MSVFNTSQRET